MADCLVSILVPVCNVERYLRQCLESLLAQTLEDIQIVCIDDGSTDLSSSILADFQKRDPRIELISKPNSGYGDSMNIGLDQVRGEYVGIVESDDFAAPDMFEKLYQLAKLHDADIVKSNFFEHSETCPPEEDLLMENLGDGPFDIPFCPLENPGVFLWSPAIWSALYKTSFLSENKIRFLPTPGASFQDTSFNFKALASAKRLVLTRKAYLHYRVSNVNSSVKSQKKVMNICDEYREIWRFAEERQLGSTQLGPLLPAIQFGGYHWNLERLMPALQPGFYSVFVAEFKDFQAKGLLHQESFNEFAWATIQSMLDNSQQHFLSHYGPERVTNSTILLLPAESPQVEQIILNCARSLGVNDELLCVCAEYNEKNQQVLHRVRQRDKRIFDARELLESEMAALISLDQIRGETLRVLVAGDSAAKEIPTWTKEELACLDAPIFLSLLANGFYEQAQAPDATLPFPGNAWFPALPEEVKLTDFQAAWEALQKIFVWANKAIPTTNFEARMALLKRIDPLWRLLRTVFENLSYSDRLEFAEAPSSYALEPAIYGPQVGSQDGLQVSSQTDSQADSQASPQTDSQTCSRVADANPKISVIIPVYNAEAHIDTCLESVLSQTVEDLELICIDDGSSDASLDKLLRHAQKDRRVRVIYQVNGGAGAVRNRALSMARGEWLAFIDSDDFYPSNDALAALLEAGERSGAKMVGGSFSSLRPDGSVIERYPAHSNFYTYRYEGFRSLQIDQNDYGWIRFLYRRSFVESTGIRFPERSWYEDPIFFCQICDAAGEYCTIPKVVYRYREDYRERTWTEAMTRDMLRGIKENLAFAKEHRYERLYTTLMHRLDTDYFDTIAENIDDEEVMHLLLAIQSEADPELITFTRETHGNVWTLRVFTELANYDFNNCAIVRVASRVANSGMYHSLQSLRLKLSGKQED